LCQTALYLYEIKILPLRQQRKLQDNHSSRRRNTSCLFPFPYP